MEETQVNGHMPDTMKPSGRKKMPKINRKQSTNMSLQQFHASKLGQTNPKVMQHSAKANPEFVVESGNEDQLNDCDADRCASSTNIHDDVDNMEKANEGISPAEQVLPAEHASLAKNATAEESSLAEGTAPVEETSPAEKTSFAEEASSMEEVSPAEEATPAVETLLREKDLPPAEVTPAGQLPPAGQASPAEKASPGEEAAQLGDLSPAKHASPTEEAPFVEEAAPVESTGKLAEPVLPKQFAEDASSAVEASPAEKDSLAEQASSTEEALSAEEVAPVEESLFAQYGSPAAEVSADKQASTAGEASPAEVHSPAEEVSSIEGASPDEEASPAEQPSPVQQTLSVEKAASYEEAPLVAEMPLPEASPAEAGPPAEESSAKDTSPVEAGAPSKWIPGAEDGLPAEDIGPYEEASPVEEVPTEYAPAEEEIAPAGASSPAVQGSQAQKTSLEEEAAPADKALPTEEALPAEQAPRAEEPSLAEEEEKLPAASPVAPVQSNTTAPSASAKEQAVTQQDLKDKLAKKLAGKALVRGRKPLAKEKHRDPGEVLKALKTQHPQFVEERKNMQSLDPQETQRHRLDSESMKEPPPYDEQRRGSKVDGLASHQKAEQQEASVLTPAIAPGSCADLQAKDTSAQKSTELEAPKAEETPQPLATDAAEEEAEPMVLTRGLVRNLLGELESAGSEEARADVLERWGFGTGPEAWNTAANGMESHFNDDTALRERWAVVACEVYSMAGTNKIQACHKATLEGVVQSERKDTVPKVCIEEVASGVRDVNHELDAMGRISEKAVALGADASDVPGMQNEAQKRCTESLFKETAEHDVDAAYTLHELIDSDANAREQRKNTMKKYTAAWMNGNVDKMKEACFDMLRSGVPAKEVEDLLLEVGQACDKATLQGAAESGRRGAMAKVCAEEVASGVGDSNHKPDVIGRISDSVVAVGADASDVPGAQKKIPKIRNQGLPKRTAKLDHVEVAYTDHHKPKNSDTNPREMRKMSMPPEDDPRALANPEVATEMCNDDAVQSACDEQQPFFTPPSSDSEAISKEKARQDALHAQLNARISANNVFVQCLSCGEERFACEAAMCSHGSHALCSDCLGNFLRSQESLQDILPCPERGCHGSFNSGATENKKIVSLLSDGDWLFFKERESQRIRQEFMAEMKRELDGQAQNEAIREEMEKMQRRELQSVLGQMISNPRQCANCGFGPIDHRGCSDLLAHHNEQDQRGGRVNNSCPNCGILYRDINHMPPWDGILPEERASSHHETPAFLQQLLREDNVKGKGKHNYDRRGKGRGSNEYPPPPQQFPPRPHRVEHRPPPQRIAGHRHFEEQEDRIPLEELELGSWVEGNVANLVSFGAFVDIGAVTDGLLHLEDASEERLENIMDRFSPGDLVTCRIKRINLKDQRISLTCRDMQVHSAEPEVGVQESEGDAEICRNFQRGHCRRGNRCPFRHVSGKANGKGNGNGKSSSSNHDQQRLPRRPRNDHVNSSHASWSTVQLRRQEENRQMQILNDYEFARRLHNSQFD